MPDAVTRKVTTLASRCPLSCTVPINPVSTNAFAISRTAPSRAVSLSFSEEARSDRLSPARPRDSR